MAQKKSGDVVTVEEAKRWLRRFLIRKRQSIPLPEKIRRSRAAVHALTATPIFRRSKTVALFIGFASEVVTDSLIEHAWKKGKRVVIPMTSKGFDRPFFALFKKGDKLQRSPFGPLELIEKKRPFDFKSIDLVVVPGLGFDSSRRRLGYGGGVYDRMLTKAKRAKHVGLFFDNQRLEALPRQRTDRDLSAVVTDAGLLR